MKKSEQTRSYIIEKTAPVFNTLGYAGTSLSDITNATKLTKGSVYGNFADKDEVALAAFDFNVEQVNRVFANALAPHSTAKAKLLAYAELYRHYEQHKFPVGGCPILNTSTECDDTHPELKRKVAAALIGWKKDLGRIIEKGIAAGEFSRKTDPEQAALTIIALLEGSVLIGRTTGKASHRELVMHSLKQYIEQLT